ncbi:hypothetical protein HOLleu_34568 [Holothuria leucospilota]|uniref:Uncharacterized protein n=1 Tax=Holothuria leucospilota TaxID=206669 RepID=A0A9Q1BGT2_HOLLE|nr:hypothetical protein HOLleu_34568 [Holothuria leucospilota]
MRRLRTDLRASMTEPRLSALAMMHLHYDMNIDLNVVVNLFARYHPEKLRKVHLLFSGGTRTRNLGGGVTLSSQLKFAMICASVNDLYNHSTHFSFYETGSQ